MGHLSGAQNAETIAAMGEAELWMVSHATSAMRPTSISTPASGLGMFRADLISRASRFLANKNPPTGFAP